MFFKYFCNVVNVFVEKYGDINRVKNKFSRGTTVRFVNNNYRLRHLMTEGVLTSRNVVQFLKLLWVVKSLENFFYQ